MKNLFLINCIVFLAFGQLYAQTNNSQLATSIRADGAAPDSSAILDVQSSSQGILVPRMTGADKLAIPSPATGLLVYDTDTNSHWYYDGTQWVNLASNFMNTPVKYNVKEYGAVGDGVTDDTAAFIRTATAVQDANDVVSKTIYFPEGEYVVSANAFDDYSDPHNNAIFRLTGHKNLAIEGDGDVVIKTNTPHDITAFGGLMVFKLTDINSLKIKNLTFLMEFEGFKNSSSFYPHCGAIHIKNEDATSENRSGDVFIEKIRMKLYHPYGAYGVTDSGNAFSGDPNNGFKIFGIFAQGSFNATSFKSNSRNITISDCIIKDGHNAYGFWVWAYNNANFNRLVAESWVTKRTRVSTGEVLGRGPGFIRHHAFNTTHVNVVDCDYRAKPSSERLTAGYEGGAEFAVLSENLAGADISTGSYIVRRNQVIMGNGDQANSIIDYGIQAYGYGQHDFGANTFEGHQDDVINAYIGACISYNAGANSHKGSATIKVIGNDFGYWLNYSNNIQIFNDATFAADRRIKQVIVAHNNSMSRSQYFFNGGTKGYDALIISNNITDGERSFYPPTSTNNRAFKIGGSEATDMISMTNNVVLNSYYGILATLNAANLPNRVVSGNIMTINVTVPKSGI